MTFIERFGALPIQAPFAIGASKFIKVGNGRAMTAKGKIVPINDRLVVEVDDPVDQKLINATEMVAALEEVRAALVA